MKPLVHRLHFRHNQFFFLNKTWQKDPIEYYHIHEGIEFLYIHEGSGRLILEDRLYILHPRTLVFFQPYQLHFIQYKSPYLRSIIKIKPPLLDTYSHLLPNLFDFSSFVENSRVDQQVFGLDPKQDDELTSQLHLFEETLSIVPGHEHKEQFQVFLLQFLSYLKSRVFNNADLIEKKYVPRQTHHVETIQKWVASNFKEPFDLNKLATDIHLSASYLSNLFRQCTGDTITEYITKKRLNEASMLLQTTTLPIDQVGKSSGFPNPAYFSRSFKKSFGLTPMQYRVKTTQPFGSQ